MFNTKFATDVFFHIDDPWDPGCPRPQVTERLCRYLLPAHFLRAALCHLVYLGIVVISAGFAVLLFSFLSSLIRPFHTTLILHYPETVADNSQFTKSKAPCSATFLRVEIFQTVGGKRLGKYFAVLNARRPHSTVFI